MALNESPRVISTKKRSTRLKAFSFLLDQENIGKMSRTLGRTRKISTQIIFPWSLSLLFVYFCVKFIGSIYFDEWTQSLFIPSDADMRASGTEPDLPNMCSVHVEVEIHCFLHLFTKYLGKRSCQDGLIQNHFTSRLAHERDKSMLSDIISKIEKPSQTAV